MAKVLLIDDHEDIRQVLMQILMIHEHTVDCLAATADALRSIDELRPEVLIVDQHLPVMSGVELLKMIRARESLRGLYVIICSGDDSIRQQALGAGAQDFWTKGSDEIFDRIARLDGDVASRRSASREPAQTREG